MSKLNRQQIPMVLTEENVLKVAVDQGVIEEQFNWKLIRESDGLTHKSKDVMWLEWDDEGKFKSNHSEPSVGRSLIMSPFNDFFTWQTTDIKEIVEQKEDYIKFKTKNSIYELFKISKTGS